MKRCLSCILILVSIGSIVSILSIDKAEALTNRPTISWETFRTVKADEDTNYAADTQKTAGTATADGTVVNKNVALKNSGDGEYGGGSGADSAIRVIISYRVHTSLGL